MKILLLKITLSLESPLDWFLCMTTLESVLRDDREGGNRLFVHTVIEDRIVKLHKIVAWAGCKVVGCVSEVKTTPPFVAMESVIINSSRLA